MKHNESDFSNTIVSRNKNNFKSFVSGRSNISKKYQISKFQAKAEVEKNEQLNSRISELERLVFSLESEKKGMERGLDKIQDELVEYRERDEEQLAKYLEETSELQRKIVSLEIKIKQYEFENI